MTQCLSKRIHCITMSTIDEDISYNVRNIESDDYENGVVELLSQLTVIDKQGVTQQLFTEYCQRLQGNQWHKTVVAFDTTYDSSVGYNIYSKQVIGIATLLIEPKLIHNCSVVGHIEDVVVDKNYRGKGLGKRLIDRLTKDARNAGCYKVILDCSECNVPFYEKCGFTRHGVEMSLYF
jgi:glucosamine-phosphate N-acetyltransferase